MRRNRTRLVRRLLILFLLLVAGAVAWSLRPRSDSRATTGPAPAGEEVGTKVGEMFFVRFNEGGRPVEVRAKAMTTDPNGSTMHLQGAEATLPFVSQGKPATATIRADRADYHPQPLRASFAGNVVVTTDDGFELRSQSLDYDSTAKELVTKDLVEFRRGIASGSARGMRYRSDSQLELWSEVKLRLAHAGAPPTDVESGTASASRDENRVYLNDGVTVRQGARELRAGRLQLNMADEFMTIQHAAAIEDVDVRVARGADLPGGGGGGLGEKRLRCRRLNVRFKEAGVPEDAVAVNPASLEVLPGPGEAPETRRISAQQIKFLFDEEGRVRQVEAYAGEAPGEVQQAVLESEPQGRGGSARRVESKGMVVALDPVGDAVRSARFERAVVFSEPGRRGWADLAVYDGGSGALNLSGTEPRIADDAQGTELRARQIEIATRSRDVRATEGVRHTMAARNGAKRKGPLGGDEPTVVVCRRFEYVAARKQARYAENAVMRAGRDEIRAPLIVIEEPSSGQRRLSASGGVSSTLHPKRAQEGGPEREPVQARSREMVYEESAHRLVYTGDVEMVQGDIQTKSPEVVVLLGRDEGSVERVLAGSPVDVRQGQRRAQGERATYTPSDQTLVLVGEKVVVHDGDRRLEGRVLTFQVGGDRIRLDGRDEVRTEAVLKRRETPRP